VFGNVVCSNSSVENSGKTPFRKTILFIVLSTFMINADLLYSRIIVYTPAPLIG
jgi:hypothetical protein